MCSLDIEHIYIALVPVGVHRLLELPYIKCCYLTSHTQLLSKKIRNLCIVQGTTFVLQKKSDPRQRLLSAISTDTGVKEVRFFLNEAPFNSRL